MLYLKIVEGIKSFPIKHFKISESAMWLTVNLKETLQVATGQLLCLSVGCKRF